MSQNRIGVEDNELIMQIEDLPSYNFTCLSDVMNPQKKITEKYVATEFIQVFEGAVKHHRLDEVAYLYDYAFNKLSVDYFSNKYWPEPYELEQADENLEIDYITQLLYTEQAYRHVYARLQNFDAEKRVKSWENYISLFECLIPKKNKKIEAIELPSKWVWDMLDEFIYQFQNFCFFRSKIRSEKDNSFDKLKGCENYPNLFDVKRVLNKFITESGIVDSNGKFADCKELKTIHYFGYYSIVALCKLYITIGDSASAQEIIGKVDYERIAIYSKSWSCLNSLFYFAGIAYLLNKKYLVATKILETIVSFSNKYKHFFTKSFQYDNIVKQLDRALLLLCICLSLNQISISATVKGLITDKYKDRFEKLQKYDKACFEESFTHGCCKMIFPLKVSGDFLTNGFATLENQDPLKETMNKFSTEFSKSQILNNVEGVLELYPRISYAKFAKIMRVEESKTNEILEDFKMSKTVTFSETPFDQTVISRIVKDVKCIKYTIKDNEIIVDADVREESHVMFFDKNSQQLEGLISKIERL